MAANAYDWHAAQAYLTRHAVPREAAKKKIARLGEILTPVGTEGRWAKDVLELSFATFERAGGSDQHRAYLGSLNEALETLRPKAQVDAREAALFCYRLLAHMCREVRDQRSAFEALCQDPAALLERLRVLEGGGVIEDWRSGLGLSRDATAVLGGVDAFAFAAAFARYKMLERFLAIFGSINCLREAKWQLTPAFYLGYFIDQVVRPPSLWLRLYCSRADAAAASDFDDEDGDGLPDQTVHCKAPAYLGNRVLAPGQLRISPSWKANVSQAWRDAIGHRCPPEVSFRPFLSLSCDAGVSLSPSLRAAKRRAFRHYLIDLASRVPRDEQVVGERQASRASLRGLLLASAARISARDAGLVQTLQQPDTTVRRLPLKRGEARRTILTSDPPSRISLLSVVNKADFAVIRYAVALLIEPGIAERFLDQARDEYAAEPELWGRFLNEQAEKDGPNGPLRAAAQRLAER